jgi:hypothetical protein
MSVPDKRKGDFFCLFSRKGTNEKEVKLRNWVNTVTFSFGL